MILPRNKDNGNTWAEENSGLTDKQVLSSAIIGNEIYIGVRGGVCKRPLKEFTAVSTGLIHNLSFSVSPSPSNDIIQITLGESNNDGELFISLFDSKGTCIKTLEIDNYSNIQMDVSNVFPGIYFLHAKIGTREGIIKVIKN